MSSDFWAGYLSGAVGIVIGNPLDIVKVRLQAGEAASTASPLLQSYGSWAKGVTAPILGYGALNALLFVSYNRTLMLLDPSIVDPSNTTASLPTIWLAGAAGGLATWAVSAPTELIKCRTQISGEGLGSLGIARDIWQHQGLRGLYLGGGITSVRDTVGYGFYFWSYELCKRYIPQAEDRTTSATVRILLCGGIAGIVTWASIFPLDVVKTRLQIQIPVANAPEYQALLTAESPAQLRPTGVLQIARQAYAEGGISIFFRGIGVCSARAFIVNAVQWAVYEWAMSALKVAS